jgi:PAS domain S-box-containing protein
MTIASTDPSQSWLLKLKVACDLAGLSPYSWDPVSHRLEWDDRLKAVWGLPPDAQVDYDIFMAGVHPDDRAAVDAAAAHCLNPDGGGVYNVEYRVIAVEGVERWISTRGRAIFAGDQPLEVIGMAMDITDTKHGEGALRKSEERFRLFAENSSRGLWIIDARLGAFLYHNPALERVWDASADAVRDVKGWLARMHPEDRDTAAEILHQIGKHGGPANLEYRIVRDDGAVRWIHDVAFAIRDEGGGIGMIGGITKDVSGPSSPLVYLIDAADRSRQHIASRLRAARFRVIEFATGRAFLEVADALAPGCVVLDICLPGSGGLTVCRTLQTRQRSLPVVVVDNHGGDAQRAVLAMKAGAIDVLCAPCEAQLLLAAVATGLAGIRAATHEDWEAQQAHKRLGALSQRERDVLDGLIAGGTNKTIARTLGLSPRTVESHRAHVMERLGAQTLPETVLIAAMAGLTASPQPRAPAA